MRSFRPTLLKLHVLALSALLTLTSCENGNLFGGLHHKGSSSDTATLVSDAQNALRDKDYNAALDYATKALEQDPNNAAALYVASAAIIGTSGLSLATTAANVFKQQAASVNLVELVHSARETYAAPATTGVGDSLLGGVSLEQLDSVIDRAICWLQKIVSGSTDGSISPSNIDVLVNLGILCALRAALRPYMAHFFDITNEGGDFEITPGDNFNAASFCTDNASLIRQMARDIIAAYACFNRAVQVLNLSGDKIILRIRNDVDHAVTLLLQSDPARTNDLPAACLSLLADIQITAANFQSNTEIFNPPSGC